MKFFFIPNEKPRSGFGFTLMELCIVGIVLAAIAGLALNNYKLTLEKNNCTNAINNLILIKNATDIASLKNYPIIPGDFQKTLKINFNDPNFRYTWEGYGTGKNAFAFRNDPPCCNIPINYACQVRLDAPLSATNPRCSDLTSTVCQNPIK